MKALLIWLGNESKAHNIALLLFGVALIVRLTALVVLPEAHVSSNARESILGGAALIQDGQFINNPDYPMLVPPLTAIFTAAIQSLFGEGLLPIKLAQIVLDACMVVFVFHIGRLIFGHITALLGAGLLTVYPFAVFVPLFIGTEALFCFFLALFMLTLTKGLRNDVLSLFFVSGLALGLATLTRGTTLFLPFFLIGFFIWYYRNQTSPKVAVKTTLFMLGFILILSPWVARNYATLDAFIPSSTSSGPLLHGSSEEFWLISDREKELPKYYSYLRNEKGIIPPTNPTWVEKDRYYRRAAIEKYKDRWDSDPASFIPFLAKKFVRLWYGTESGENVAIVIAINIPIYILGLVGLWYLANARNRLGTLLILLLAYFVAIHVAVFAYFRYVIPIMPYVVLLAAYGGLHLIRSKDVKKTSTV